MIEIRQLTKIFGDGAEAFKALDDVSVTIAATDCSVVVSADLAAFALAELDIVVSALPPVAALVAESMNLGLLPKDSAEFAVANSTAQQTMWGLVRPFCTAQASAVYVGFPDQAVVFFGCDDKFGLQSTFSGGTYFGLKEPQNNPLRYYLLDADTGLATITPTPLDSDTFTTTTRPWFSGAASLW